jgi:hypothetical protein
MQDLQTARAAYVLKSKAFTPASRARALAFIDRLEARAGLLSDAEFLIGIVEIAGFAGNGHDAGPGANAASPAHEFGRKGG